MHILVIEDDQMLRKALSQYLLEKGHTISAAANGKDALEIAKHNSHLQVVICDLLMPEISGPTFILMLKKYFPEKSPVIIIMTAVKDGEDFLKKIDISYDYYFAKPIDFEVLDEVFEKIKSDL